MAINAAESENVFFARLSALSLIDLKPKFVERGWTTFADFALGCSDFTGKDAAKFQSEIVEPLVGAETARITKHRRLFVQAYAAHAAFLEKMDAPPSAQPIQLHPLDREASMKTTRDRLTGIDVDGDSEPSHALINKMATILTHGVIKCPPWEALTSRNQEIDNVDEAPGMKIIETPDGSAAFVPLPHAEGSADLSGEMRWDIAMQRRGVAMEVSGLMVYEAHSQWHATMKKAFLSDPPPNYRRPTWAQLRNADKELWKRVASTCPSGCRADPAADKTNFEVAWRREMASTEVKHFLLPMPLAVGSSSTSSSWPSGSSPAPSQDGRLHKLENKLKNCQEQLKRKSENINGGKGWGGGKDKKKGKGKGKKGFLHARV